MSINHLLTWLWKGHKQNWIMSHREETQVNVFELQTWHKTWTKVPIYKYISNPFLLHIYDFSILQWLTASSFHCFLHQIPMLVSTSAESTQKWSQWQSRDAGDETLALFRSWCRPSVPEICPLSVALRQWLHPAIWGTCSWADRASLTWTKLIIIMTLWVLSCIAGRQMEEEKEREREGHSKIRRLVSFNLNVMSRYINQS